MKNSEKSSSPSLRIDLKVIEENEPNSQSGLPDLFEEESNLAYDSEYKPDLKRKSTLSTSLSLSESFQEKNGFSPVKSLVNNINSNNNICINNNGKKIIFSEYKKSKSSKINSNNNLTNISNNYVFFGRERYNSSPLSPLGLFYEGTDLFLRKQFPEGENYKETKNYIKKNDFFNDIFSSTDSCNNTYNNYNSNNLQNSSSSLGEVALDESIQSQKNCPIILTPKISVDFRYSSSKNLTNIINNNNINTTNNNLNNNNNDNEKNNETDSPNNRVGFELLPSTPSNSVENFTRQTEASSTNNLPKFSPSNGNSIYGKFDFPMYCVGYYSFDCKFFF